MLSGVCAKMFDIGIISIVVLAVGYWVTLWLMGRRDDVLHGDFVHAEERTEAPEISDQPFVDRPPFPSRPVIRRTTAAGSSPQRSVATKPAPAGTLATPAPAAPPTQSSARADRADTLQALLASIKRDLKDASQL